MNAATNYLLPSTLGTLSICVTTAYYQVSATATIIIAITILTAIFLIISQSEQLFPIISTNAFEKSLSSSSGSNFFRLLYTNGFTSTSANRSPKQQQRPRRRLDSKYFKPKFIIHELISIWGTTYTVITWGSFYFIGGTIVATEKLAQKVKSKCTREQRGLHNESSSRGTGWADSFASFGSSDSDDDDQHNASASSINDNTLRRLSSWTKRSYSASKKKIMKLFTSTNAPQLTGAAAASRPDSS